jgi:hypothetical protein
MCAHAGRDRREARGPTAGRTAADGFAPWASGICPEDRRLGGPGSSAVSCSVLSGCSGVQAASPFAGRLASSAAAGSIVPQYIAEA